MSFKSSLFVFILSLIVLSMHAMCKGRNIEGFHAKVHFSDKVGAQKVDEHNMDSVHGINDYRLSAGIGAPGAAAIMTRESKDSKAVSKSSGSETVKPPNSHVVLLKATNIEGNSTRRALSVVEFGSNNVKKAIDSDENKVGEDSVVIDYEPPRRTPPIHNKKKLE